MGYFRRLAYNRGNDSRVYFRLLLLLEGYTAKSPTPPDGKFIRFKRKGPLLSHPG